MQADAEQSRWLAVQLQVEELQAELQEQQRDLDRLAATLRALAEPEAESEPKPLPSAAPESEPTAGLHDTPSRLPAPPEFCPCPDLSTDPPL